MKLNRSHTASLTGRIITAIIVIGCLLVAWKLPLWSMKLVAPMYPKGLMMVAYGDKLEGDLYELNIVNHYVGMKHISIDEFSLISLFPIGLAGIALLGIAQIFLPKFRRICAWLTFVFPLGILASIQYYLYVFGHGLNPDAPIKIPEFTPIVIGNSTIVNFTAVSMIGWGLAALFLAAALIGFSNWLFPERHKVFQSNQLRKDLPARSPFTATATIFIVFFCSPVLASNNLQEQINKALPGDTVFIHSGSYQGPIKITKPLYLKGVNQPTINGDRKNDVVTIASDYVTFDGFDIRFSGTEITEEASGIRVQGKNICVRNNTISDVYFGIHILQADNVVIASNTIRPTQSYAGRPGHGVNAWNVKNLWVINNRIDDARDGVLLTYVENANVRGNLITRSRYGLHSMYSSKIDFSNNIVRDNLLGIALMYSKVLTAENNTILDHRRGTSPFGFLLKDIDNALIVNNYIQANQMGIFAEGLSMAYGSNSIIRGNTIVGNQIGISVQSSAKFTFYGNNLIENLADVQKQTDHIHRETRWSVGDTGNYWSSYHGYDNNSDNIGDVGHEIYEIPELTFDRNTPSRAFMYSPGYLVLESAIRMFPSFRSAAILHDSVPVLTPKDIPAKSKTESGLSIFSIASLFLLASSIVGVKYYHPFAKQRP